MRHIKLFEGFKDEPEKELFDKEQLITLIKSYNFKGADVSKINNCEYISKYNPFDKNFVAEVIFDDEIIMSIDKSNDNYVITIGKYSGWIGGLVIGDAEITFDIKELTFDELSKGFEYATKNPIYSLVKKASTGNISEVITTGTENEIFDKAKELGYKTGLSKSKIFPYYFINDKHDTLSVCVLNSIQRNNF